VKTRRCFVANSSSSSFVIGFKNENITKEHVKEYCQPLLDKIENDMVKFLYDKMTKSCDFYDNYVNRWTSQEGCEEVKKIKEGLLKNYKIKSMQVVSIDNCSYIGALLYDFYTEDLSDLESTDKIKTIAVPDEIYDVK
jgi:hypothetical protein